LPWCAAADLVLVACRLEEESSVMDRELSKLHRVIQNTSAWRLGSVQEGLRSLVDRSCAAAGIGPEQQQQEQDALQLQRQLQRQQQQQQQER
jgi:hypothetical protein